MGIIAQIRFLALLTSLTVSLALTLAPACPAEEAAAPVTRLFDTGTRTDDMLVSSEVKFIDMAGWTQVPENDLAYRFKGDVALANDRLVVLLHWKGCGAEVYTRANGKAKQWGRLGASANRAPLRAPAAMRILENTPGAVAVEIVWDGPASATFRLTTGQPYLEVRPGPGMTGIRGDTHTFPRCVVVPDFFGDDMVFATGTIKEFRPRLPVENCLIGLGGRTHDILAICMWQDRAETVRANVFRVNDVIYYLCGIDITCVAGKTLWFAVLEAPDIWHELTVAEDDAAKPLAWQPPFPAKWRADRIGKDSFAESITFEAPPPAGVPMPTLKAGKYVIYPIDRTKATPLTTFTPVDIMRNTLGFGPCQYILETEGLASQDPPTPDQVMTWIEKQFKRGKQKESADEIRERLKAMAELVGRTETRINRYADFAAELQKLLTAEDSTNGRLLKATVGVLAESAAAGLSATSKTRRVEDPPGRSEPPGRIAKLSDAVIGLIGKDTAAADLAPLAAEIRGIGAAQDRALAKGRMAVRWLNCQASSFAAPSPDALLMEKEISKRTEAFLVGK